jgi:DNA-binding SARP family transcriptional activator
MMRLRTLGSISLRDENGSEIRSVLAQPKRLALLAMVALHHGGTCRRDQLLGLFWPDHDVDHGRAALRQAVRFLRSRIGCDAIVNVGNEVLAVNALEVECDARHFDRASDEHRLEDALLLYQGDLLPGLFVPDASPELDSWLERERHRLRRRALDAASELVERYRARGQLMLAARWSWRALSLAPDDERLLRALLELLCAAGDSAGAIRAYEHFVADLHHDLGMKPSPLTQRLAASIRAETSVVGIASTGIPTSAS